MDIVVTPNPLIAALWSLREDAIFAHKQALQGEAPNLVALDVAYHNVVNAVQQLDQKGSGAK